MYDMSLAHEWDINEEKSHVLMMCSHCSCVVINEEVPHVC